MKILKEFNSSWLSRPEYHLLMNYPNLKWGLSEDGQLYWKASVKEYPFGKEWYSWNKDPFAIPISEMKHIIKEFGHLLIFT